MFHKVEYVTNVMYLSLSFIGQHVQHANCYGTFFKGGVGHLMFKEQLWHPHCD